MSNTASSSGEITASFVNISDVFTQYSEIPTAGFNTLYKAQRFGKWFILKGLKEEFKKSAVHQELLAKEFAMGILLSHENIVRFYGKENDPVVGDCIVMEYVDGSTLSDFLKTEPRRRVREKIAMQLLEAMAYYQSLQIIHRDLKLENILITRNGNNVKIIDFGLGDTDTSAIFKQPAGSPKYMAPEQSDGNIEIDARADLYSFSIIVQSLFCHLPSSWRKVARWCGQADRDKRPANAEEVLQYIQHSKKRRSIVFPMIVLLFFIVSVIVFFQLYLKNFVLNKETTVVETIKESDSSSLELLPTESVLVHDTVVKYKEKAEITMEMKQFLKQASDDFWSQFDEAYNKEDRFTRLLAGESGNRQEDLKLYYELLDVYKDLTQRQSIVFEKEIQPALVKKFPTGKYVDSFELTSTYYKYSGVKYEKIAYLLNDVYTAIANYDK